MPQSPIPTIGMHELRNEPCAASLRFVFSHPLSRQQGHDFMSELAHRLLLPLYGWSR
jgi:hypothetical protein